jgi:hypothetical protein
MHCISVTVNCTFLLHSGFLFELLFSHEGGNNIFIRNVSWIPADYYALHPRRVEFSIVLKYADRLCGLVVRDSGYRSRGLGSIPGATKFYEKKWVWNGVLSAS